MGYCLKRLDELVFIAVPKPMLTDFGIHHRLESCVQLQRSEVRVNPFELLCWNVNQFSGKTRLQCLGGNEGNCDESFELSVLQNALKPNLFSKWLKKIQADELEKADIEGLESCPFCPFATIMDSTPEENKVHTCLWNLFLVKTKTIGFTWNL